MLNLFQHPWSALFFGTAPFCLTQRRKGAKKKAWADRPHILSTTQSAATSKEEGRFAANKASSRLCAFA
jgi:hypothetical protein